MKEITEKQFIDGMLEEHGECIIMMMGLCGNTNLTGDLYSINADDDSIAITTMNDEGIKIKRDFVKSFMYDQKEPEINRYSVIFNNETWSHATFEFPADCFN